MFTQKYYNRLTTTMFILMVFSLGITILPSDAKIDDGMIAGMWTFEEGKGETVTDLSEHGSDGEFVGDLKWVKGKFGGGLEFNGADTWVKIGTKGEADTLAALDFKESEGFSIHAWVMADGAPGGKCIIWKGLGCSTWSQYLLGTGAHENGVNHAQAAFHIRNGNGGARIEVFGDPIPASEWTHVVGVWDGKQIHVYLNGELQDSVDAANPPWASPEEVYLGADPGCGRRCQWKGIMDEVVVFNVPLSEGDVKSLGNGIEGALSVDAAGKTTTTWGKLKATH